MRPATGRKKTDRGWLAPDNAEFQETQSDREKPVRGRIKHEAEQLGQRERATAGSGLSRA